MNSLQRNSLAVARVLVAVIFLINGFGLIPQGGPAKDLAAHGAPAVLVTLLMLAAHTIEIAGGFGLILGIYPQIAAIAVIVFLVPATFVAHDFWHAVGNPTYIPQLLQFLKNLTMTGGLLFIAATAESTHTVSALTAVKESVMTPSFFSFRCDSRRIERNQS